MLVPCSSCGKRVSDRAPACPFCRTPLVATPSAPSPASPPVAPSAPAPAAVATPPVRPPFVPSAAAAPVVPPAPAPAPAPLVLPSALPAFERGDFIGDRYQVVDVLGEGGFGIVYLARNLSTNSLVALKTLRGELLRDEKTRAMFVKEARIWIELGAHPNLVRADSVDEIAGRLYISMEFVQAGAGRPNSLEGHLERGPIPSESGLRWAIEFCRGMEYALSRGIRCHRDIKPANILIGGDGRVRISDFGIAGLALSPEAPGDPGEVEHAAEDAEVGKTVAGTVFGTPSHMSPEQFKDAASCDERSDIYSFGVVLYQMATGGRLPFLPAPPPPHLASQAGMYYWFSFRRMHETATPASVPGPLGPSIARCLAKNPGERYQAFSDLRQDLERLYEEAVGARAPEGPAAQETSRDLNARGISLATLGRWDEALECYDRALAMEPDVAAFHSNRGNALRNLGRAAEALASLERAIGLDPLAAGPWLNKSLLYVHAQRNEDALSCIDHSLGLDPTSADAWVIRGVVLGRLGRNADQLAAYDRAIELDPRDASAWFNKANTLSLSNRAEALRCVDQALASDPTHVSAWSLKGTMLGELGRAAEAVPCHLEAVRLSPGEATLRYNLGNAWAALGRLEDARSAYEDSVRLDPETAITWYNLGLTTFRLGRHGECVPFLERFLSFDPPPDGLRSTAERIIRELRAGRVPQLGPLVVGARIDAVEQATVDATALSPATTSAPPPTASPAAVAAPSPALAAPPPIKVPAPARRPEAEPLPPPQPSIDTLNQESADHFNAGRYEAALDAVVRALAVEPQDAIALNTRANALYKLGRKEEACAVTVEAIEAAPGDVRFWMNRVAIQRGAGLTADAFRSAIDLVDIARAANLNVPAVSQAQQVIAQMQSLRTTPAPRGSLGHLGLGFAAMVNRKGDAALGFFDQAIAAAPERSAPLRWKASALKEMKRADEALATLDRAILLAPDDADLHHDRGVVLAMLRDLPRALEAFDRALALNPNHVATLSDKGKYAGEAGKKEEAWRALRRAAALRPDHPAPWLNKALVEDLLNLEEDALQSFEKFLERARPEMRLQIESSKRRVAQLRARIAARAGAMVSPPAPSPVPNEAPAQAKTDASASAPGKDAAAEEAFLRSVAGLFTGDDEDISDEELARLGKAISSNDGESLLQRLQRTRGALLQGPGGAPPAASVAPAAPGLPARPAAPAAAAAPVAPAQPAPERPKPTGNPVARKFAEQGRAALGASKFADALTAFDKAIERDPNEPLYWAQRASALDGLNRPDDARAARLRALDLDGGCAPALMGLALSERASGNDEDAESRLKQICGLDPGNGAAWFQLGDIYRHRADWEHAFAAFSFAIQAKRDDAEALLGRGEALLNLHRSTEALPALEESIRLKEANGAAHFLLGAALADVGRIAEAASAQRRAVELEPMRAGAWFNLAHNLHALRRDAEAVEAADRALALRPGFAYAHNTKGLALAALRRHEEALAAFDAAIAADAKSAQAWTNRGQALLALGRAMDAFESFNQAIAIDESNLAAHEGRKAAFATFQKDLAAREEKQKEAAIGLELPPAEVPKVASRFSSDECLKRSEMTRNQALFDQAIDWANQAITTDPIRYNGWAAKAEALFGAKRYAEAAAHAKKTVEINPKFPPGWARLAACYDALNAHELAVGAWDRAIELAPRNVIHMSARGASLAKMGRLEDALQAHEAALAIDPRFSLAKFHKGMIEADLGRRGDALKSLQQFLALAPPNLAALAQQARARLAELKA